MKRLDYWLRRRYMKTHGFKEEYNPLFRFYAYKREGVSDKEISDPNNMVLEPFLYSMSWKEIIKRYERRYI